VSVIPHGKTASRVSDESSGSEVHRQDRIPLILCSPSGAQQHPMAIFFANVTAAAL